MQPKTAGSNRQLTRQTSSSVYVECIKLVMSFAADWRWSLLATVCWMLAQHLPCVLASNVCLQVPPGGSCGKYELRYFYKSEDKECTEFHWEGCNATETTGNVFLTAEECIDTCDGVVPTTKPIVTLPSGLPTGPSGHTIIPLVPTDPGSPPTGSLFNATIHCFLTVDKGQAVENFGPFQRYFFNKSQQCEEFTFLGLGGNFNNFKDEEDCLDKCGHLSPNQPTVLTSSGDTPTTSNETESPPPYFTPLTFVPPPIVVVPSEFPDKQPNLPDISTTSPTTDTHPVTSPGTNVDGSVNSPEDVVTIAISNDATVDVEEDDNAAHLFLYASIAVAMLVALVSLVAAAVAGLMVYHYLACKTHDLKFTGHPVRPRATLPSTSTCSSSISV